MRYVRKFWPTLLTLPLIAVITIAVIARWPAQPELTSEVYAQSSGDDRAPQTERALFAGWVEEYAEQGLVTKTPIPLRFSRAFSKHFTKAHGKVELNFQTSQVSVSAEGLEPLPAGEKYELWLIDHIEGAENTAAIEFGEHGDRILNLGPLSPGSIAATLDAPNLDTFVGDAAAVMRITPTEQPEFIIGGMQSIRYQIGRRGISPQPDSIGLKVGNRVLPLTLVQKGGPKQQALQALIERGRQLFEEPESGATFGGNGRTCATCHPTNGDLTIDRNFIEFLHDNFPSDPLFASEFNPSLPPFEPAKRTKPAFEDPFLMLTRGLILENIAGFETHVDPDTGEVVLDNPPFFRAVPSMFNMELTAPFGLGGNVPDLQTFAVDAVFQHFTKTLARDPDPIPPAIPDFRVPTAADLQALEAFMLSLRSSSTFKITGRGSLLSTQADPRAVDITRPVVAGREKFLSVGCRVCHSSTVFSGGNFNTNVEAFEERLFGNLIPTTDEGRVNPVTRRGDGTFNTPQLFGLRKAHFFHTGVLGNHTEPDPDTGKSAQFRNIREAITFYLSPEFAINDSGLSATFNQMTPADLNNIADFLVAISRDP